MRILVTGAGGNVGKGIVPRLATAGHQLVLSDVSRPPETAPFAGHRFVQCDVQAGFGLERAVEGTDLVVHLPAWHGIHWQQRTEADYWRLNVDGTFWAFQAAKAAGVTRFVFLSSQSWHHAYDKYGFTKRIGEELCEYHRRNSRMRVVAIRPADLTPWGDDWVNHYGARLLYGGVDREDVLDAVQRAVEHLSRPAAEAAEPEMLIVNAVRPNVYTADQVAGWEKDPLAACERLFPGSRGLVERYRIDIRRMPAISNYGDNDEAAVQYRPSRYFGTFLEELRRVDARGGPDAVRAMHCPY